MLTALLHVMFFVMAYIRKNRATSMDQRTIKNAIVWVLLPDAIERYFGNSASSHFRRGSWIKFPTPTVLQLLTKTAAKKTIKHEMLKGGKVIGNISLQTFDLHNYEHRYYHEIKSHLLRDKFFEDYVMEYVVEETEDHKYILRKNRNVILTEEEFQAQKSKLLGL